MKLSVYSGPMSVFQRDCEYDSVRVSSGVGKESKLHGVYCGASLPTTVTSEVNTLRIEFNSDNSVQKSGFMAKYMTGEQAFLHLKMTSVTFLNTLFQFYPF